MARDSVQSSYSIAVGCCCCKGREERGFHASDVCFLFLIVRWISLFYF